MIARPPMYFKNMLKNIFFFVVTLALVLCLAFLLYDEKILEEQSSCANDNNHMYFTTALGNVKINEIEKNVFNEFGYSLIKNEMIPVLNKQISQTCQNVFFEWQKVADKGLTISPPSAIPDSKTFLLNGYARVNYAYFNETPKNKDENVKIWNETFIDNLVNSTIKNSSQLKPTYGADSLAVDAATKHYNIRGKVGAVIGSQTPWVEVYALANGAKHVTTVDYQKIKIDHPKMAFLYALDLVSQSEKYYSKFDFIVSFSSIEHSGLGRYGDPIDPIGDIREMNKINCMLKPGGLLFVGFPVGVDSIVYNAHRVYGRIRLAMMFQGFQLLNVFLSENIVLNQDLQKAFDGNKSIDQYLFVLKKLEK